MNLGNKGLFIIKLGQKSTGILLLALDRGLQLLPGSLEIAHRFLGHLQLALNLPPFLFHLGSATLLPFQRGFQLVEGRLKLVLDLVEMGNLVFGDRQILGRLGGVLTHMLLLLVELVDDL